MGNKSGKQEEQFLSIPYTILLNKELKDGDKITLALIYSFHKNKKKIYMSNFKLGKILGISRTAASERITKLENLGYIKCERIMINGKKQRTIVPLRMVGEPNTLVGQPNTLVGQPNSTSRCTDALLVGEVGSIIYPLLNKELNTLSHKLLNKENLKQSIDKMKIPEDITTAIIYYFEGCSTKIQRELLLKHKSKLDKDPVIAELIKNLI